MLNQKGFSYLIILLGLTVLLILSGITHFIQQSSITVRLPSIKLNPSPTSSLTISFLPSSCINDSDCYLVNKEHISNCCDGTSCEPINYALDKWIAVNQKNLEEQKSRICPKNQTCPPSRMCLPKPINDGYVAKCVSNSCQKKPLKTLTQPVACAADVKQCPDGSYVARMIPNCEFASCIK